MDIRPRVEAAVGMVADIAGNLANRIENDPRSMPLIRRLAAATFALSLAAVGPAADLSEARAGAEACVIVEGCSNLERAQRAIDDFESGRITATSDRSGRNSENKDSFVLPREYRTAERRIDAMNLSVEGYLDFLTKIDRSHLAYAQRFNAFNPNKSGIDQNKTKTIVEHFTVRPYGIIDVRRFIVGMDRRDTSSSDSRKPTEDGCCAVQWLINGDEDATVYQLAPIDAKLAHAYPFNDWTIGIEVSAQTQGAITTKQYQNMTYLEVFLLQSNGLLDAGKLDERVRGHGEMSDEIIEHWNATHSDSEDMEGRNDFNAPVAKYRRAKLRAFILENPGLALITPELLGIK